MMRFATSPTGNMHIDTLRVAIINYLVAKQRQEPFLVRIDDGDKSQNIEGKDTEIMQVLEKFAIMHDQVFHQSEHLHMHQTLAIRLLEEKKAFICTCSTKGESVCQSGNCAQMEREAYTKLKAQEEPFVIRAHKPETPVCLDDAIQGTLTFKPQSIGEITILDAKGLPSWLFASACDDMLSDISLLVSPYAQQEATARQIHLKALLGYQTQSRHAHLGALLTLSGEKAEEAEETSLLWLFSQGFIPDAIVNYLLLLGNEKAPQEPFTLPEALAWFELDALSASAVTFDLEKLRELNREHLKRIDDKQLSALFGFADADIGKLAKLYLDEVSTIQELEAVIKPIFSPKPFENEHEEVMRKLQQVLIDAPMFQTFQELEAYVQEETGFSPKEIEKPLRLLFTGTDHGPELSKIYPYIRCYLLEVIS